MKNQTVKKSRKLLSTLLVCGTLLGAVSAAGAVLVDNGGSSSIAFAEETPTVPPTFTYDEVTQRKLTIHKYSNPTDAEEATGTSEDEKKIDDTNKPLANVTFKIQQVKPIAGSTSSTIIASDSTTYTLSGSEQKKTTGLTGTVEFDFGSTSANDGVYLVTEVSNPSAKKDKDGKPILVKPFVVQIPLTTHNADGSNKSVTYDVNVYPKNEVADVTLAPKKTFSDTSTIKSVQPGGKVSWDLTANVPDDIYTAADTTTGAPEVYANTFRVVDPLDTKALTLAEEPFSAKVVNSAGDSQELSGTDGGDFIFDGFTDATPDAGYTPYQFALTQKGMKTVAEFTGTGKKVVFTLKTIVNTGLGSDAVISNTFDTLYEGPTGEKVPETTVPTDPTNPTPVDPENPTIPENPNNPGTTVPTVVMGNVDILKTNEADKPLANAVFKLAETEAKAKAKDWVKDASDPTGETDLTVKTNEEGKAEFNGLLVNEDTKIKDYYLVETSAPVGYDVDGKIHKVTAKQDTDTDATVVDIDNKLVPNLPMTGDDARLILLISASTLIVAGGAALYIYRRKEQAKQLAVTVERAYLCMMEVPLFLGRRRLHEAQETIVSCAACQPCLSCIQSTNVLTDKVGAKIDYTDKSLIPEQVVATDYLSGLIGSTVSYDVLDPWQADLLKDIPYVYAGEGMSAFNYTPDPLSVTLTVDSTDNKVIPMKKIAEVTKLPTAMPEAIPETTPAKGIFGDVEWYIDLGGTLHFGEGTFGDMGTLTESPWKDNNDLIKTISFEGSVKANTSMSNLFANLTNVTAISGLAKVDVSATENMNGTFSNMTSLPVLDFSGWQTPNVTNMLNMLSGDTSLKEVTFGSGFVTPQVTTAETAGQLELPNDTGVIKWQNVAEGTVTEPLGEEFIGAYKSGTNVPDTYVLVNDTVTLNFPNTGSNLRLIALISASGMILFGLLGASWYKRKQNMK